MSVSINNLFNYSRSLPVPFDTMTNKKVKVASMYGAKTESTLCGSVIKAVHAMCRCMNGTGEGAVGQIDTNKSVAEYKSSVGPDAYHLVVFDAASGSALASVYDKNTELIEQYVAHPSQRDGAAIFFALMPFLMSDAEFDETFQEYYDQFIAGYASIKQPTIIQANLFGKLEIISATDVLKDDSFTNESGYVLLTFLLLNRKREHPLRLLTDVIWESTDMGNPYNSIKNVVYRLRKTLACIGLRDLIQASHGTFTLNPNYTIFTDVERFDDACKRIDNSSDPAILQALYESIIGLYRGSLLPRYDFYHWLMPKTLYYQNKFLHYMKRYLSMLYREKNYLRVQELSMDLLSIDMYESEVHYHLIKAMLMSGSKTLSQIYFRQAEPYLTDEHMQEVKTLFTSCRT